jgi:hypothetical protein
MNDLEKFQVLLPHWIEHNAEHADELRTWAERIQLMGEEDAAEKLFAAAASLQNAGDPLSMLLDEVGDIAGRDERQEQL